MTSIGIGIPVFNDFILVNYLLDSIMRYTDRKSVKILVLDDGSTKENQEETKRVCSFYDVECACHDKNLGVSTSWNHLVEALKTDYIILLNNDILVFQKWFETMKLFLENNPNIGTVSLPTILIDKQDISSTVRNPDKRSIDILDHATKIKRSGVCNLPESKPPIRVISPIGCSFGFRRDKFDMIGGFDKKYFAFYEELDFGIRLYNRGLPSVILPGPHLYHIWGATFQKNQQIDPVKIMENSRKIFISKHGEDKMNIFRKLNHNFETAISYLDINDNVQKTITLKETYPPDSDMGW